MLPDDIELRRITQVRLHSVCISSSLTEWHARDQRRASKAQQITG